MKNNGPHDIEDVIRPDTFRIYYKVEMRPATADKIVGLKKAAIYKPEQLVARIKEEITV
jgi:hypothetical protein